MCVCVCVCVCVCLCVCVCVCLCEREREREREREIPSSTLKPLTIQYVFLNCIVSMEVRFRYTKSNLTLNKKGTRFQSE